MKKSILLLSLFTIIFQSFLFAQNPITNALPATNIRSSSAKMNGEVDPAGYASMYWTFRLRTTSTYAVRSDYSHPISGNGIVKISLDTINLKPNTKYYYWVQLDWLTAILHTIEPISFTTLPIVQPLSPSDSSTNQNNSMNFKWNKTDSTASYWLQVATDTLFSATSIVYQDSTLTDTSKTVSNLLNGTKYFWRVSGKVNRVNLSQYFNNGQMDWSSRRQFITVSQFTVSGTVKQNGTGVGSIRITIHSVSDNSDTTIVTGLDGKYSVAVIGNRTYTITPTSSFYKFVPDSIITGTLTSNLTGQDFSATLITFTISGTVRENNLPLSGVSVNVRGIGGGAGATLTTGVDGKYLFTVLGGQYIIKPSKDNYKFVPDSILTENISSNISNQDFVGTLIPQTYLISGMITVNGLPLSGVTVGITNNQLPITNGEQVTGNDGKYSFTLDAGKDYTVTPSKTGYTFSPVSKTFAQLGSDQIQDFAATVNTLNPPNLVSPRNDSTNVYYPSVTFLFTKVSNSGGYRIVVSSDSAFANIIKTDSLTDTIYVMQMLKAHSTYYWKVRAGNSIAQSDWSLVWKFTTLNNKPSKPRLLLPVDSSMVQLLYPGSIMLKFNWNRSTDADGDNLTYCMGYVSDNHSGEGIIGSTDTVASYSMSNFEKGKTYRWFVVVTDGIDTVSSDTSVFTTSATVTSVKNQSLATSYSLSQNYPNPFNPTTTITYQVASEKVVRLMVYNLQGQEVKTLVNEPKSDGQYSATWDGRDNFGRMVPSGTYFYCLTAGNFVQTNKMILMK